MLIAAFAVVLVAIGAVVTKLTWRPNPDETHSVRKYSTALGTMGHVSERIGRLSGSAGESGTPTYPPTRVGSHSVHITTDGAAGESAHSAHPGPVAVPGTPRIDLSGYEAEAEAEAEGVPVFEDGAHPDPGRYSTAAQLAPEFRSERARKQALHSMDHRDRRRTMSAAVVVVVAAFGVLAYVGSHRSGHHATANTRASIVSAKHPGTGPNRTLVHRPKSSHHGSTGSVTTTTTTTQPPSQLVATSSTGAAAIYSVSSDSYNVVVTAAGACWVDAIIASSGATAWTGTLQPGSSQVIHGVGDMHVELGAFGATMSVDNVPVVFPSPYQAPFTATFEPVSTATPGSAGAPTTASSGSASSQG